MKRTLSYLFSAGLLRVMATVVASGLISAAQPQGAAAQGPQFDVASIKPVDSADGHMMYRFSWSGLFTASAPLQGLIRLAYGVRDFQLVGAPRWVSSDAYSIQAKTDQGSTQDQMLLMLRSLLEDRFHLMVHKEFRESHIYRIMTVGKPRLLPAKAGACFVPSPEVPPPPPLPGDSDPWVCGKLYSYPMELFGKSLQLSTLADGLSARIGVAVLDATGQSGKFDISLKWTLDDKDLPAEAGFEPELAARDMVLPSLLTALREQLGLKLESGRGPVEVLVVDSVQRPSEN